MGKDARMDMQNKSGAMAIMLASEIVPSLPQSWGPAALHADFWQRCSGLSSINPYGSLDVWSHSLRDFDALVSVSTIMVILGEIVPQSACSRHPLAIGPLVYLSVSLTFVVSSLLLLAYKLGEDMGTVYSRNQVKGVLEIYASMKETDFGAEKTNMMAGVVDFSKTTVGECTNDTIQRGTAMNLLNL